MTTTSTHTRALALAALAALLMAAHLPTAHAHARWVCPVPRSTNTGIKVRAHSAATNGNQRRGAPPAHPR